MLILHLFTSLHSIDQVDYGIINNEHAHSISTNSNYSIKLNGSNDSLTKGLVGSSNQMSSCDYMSSHTATAGTKAAADDNQGSIFVGINDETDNKKIS